MMCHNLCLNLPHLLLLVTYYDSTNDFQTAKLIVFGCKDTKVAPSVLCLCVFLACSGH